MVLDSYPYETYKTTAAELLEKARAAKTNLRQSGEGERIPVHDDLVSDDEDLYEQEQEQEGLSFDSLVPLFYR